MTRPTSRMVMPSSSLSDPSYSTNFGSDNTPRSILGSVEKLGEKYANAKVCIFRKTDMQLLAVRKHDTSGNYIISGLNKDIITFIVAFDDNQQYNAVIQDNVIPK